MNQQTREWMDSIDPLDEHGFQIRAHQYWLPESPADELKRLEMNLAIYREFLKNGSRFTDEVNAARRKEYLRIDELKGGPLSVWEGI